MTSKRALFPQCVACGRVASREGDNGQDLVEYALIVLLVAVLIAGALGVFGGEMSDVYNQMANQIPS